MMVNFFLKLTVLALLKPISILAYSNENNDNDSMLMCENWCSNHPAPWTSSNFTESQKCHWPKTCSGCHECQDEEVSPYGDSKCKPWCYTNPNPWTDQDQSKPQKCSWSLNCAHCSECKMKNYNNSSSSIDNASEEEINANETIISSEDHCEPWCKNHDTPWFDNSESKSSTSQKCSWHKTCGGCPECNDSYLNFSNDVDLEALMESEPTAAPAKSCASWCVNHATPWRDLDPTKPQKCNWPKTCGGCHQCNSYFDIDFLPEIIYPSVSPTKMVNMNTLQESLTNTPSMIPSTHPSNDPSNAPSSLPVVEELCTFLCYSAKLPWSMKCSWTRSCGACSPCST